LTEAPASLPPGVASFWAVYTHAVGGVDPARFYEAFFFADSEALANTLVELVLSGKKQATAGSVASYEAEGKRLPAPGDLSVVTDWAGVPKCIIETVAVDLVPFDQVTEAFAAIEGEGDGSLAYWQEAHRQYFERECSRLGSTFTEKILLACERFKVVFPLAENNSA
jgi:uncharacterized protein YhfF